MELDKIKRAYNLRLWKRIMSKRSDGIGLTWEEKQYLWIKNVTANPYVTFDTLKGTVYHGT